MCSSDLALREAVDARDVTVSRVPGGLLLQLTETVLFAPGKEALTAQGQRVVSSVATAVSAVRSGRLEVRIGVAGAVEGGTDQARADRRIAVNRGAAIVREFDQHGVMLPELVFLAADHQNGRSGDSSATSASAIPSIHAGSIQLLVVWPAGP